MPRARIVMSGLCVLLLAACGASDEAWAMQAEIAQRYGFNPRRIWIRTSDSLTLTIIEPTGSHATDADRAALARALAADLGRLHDRERHAEYVTVRFIRVSRSDLFTRRHETSFSYRVTELSAR